MKARDSFGRDRLAAVRLATCVGVVVAAGSLLIHFGVELGPAGESWIFAALAFAAAWVAMRHHQRVLGESEERYRRVAENAADVIFRVRIRPDIRLEYANAACERVTGRAPSELYGRSGLGNLLIHPDDLEAVLVALRSVPEESFSLPPARLVTSEGSYVWMETRCVPVKDASGEVIAVEGIARDVTDARAAQEALRTSESRFRLLVDGLDAIFWEGTPDPPAFTFVSRGAETKLGYPVESWLASFDFWSGHIHPDDREETLRKCLEATRLGRDHVLTYRMIAADGRVVWFEDLVRVTPDARGNASRFAGVMVDITDRMRVQVELERELAVSAGMAALKEQLLRAVTVQEICDATLGQARALTESPFGFVARLDPRSGALVAPAFTAEVCPMTNPDAADLVIKESGGLMGRMLARREPVLSNDVPGDSRGSMKTPPGHARIERFLSVPALWGDELVGQIAVANASRPYTAHDLRVLQRLAPDVALALIRLRAEGEQLRLQEALTQSASDWRRTFDTMQTAVVVLDGEARIQRLNRAAAAALGTDYKEAIGQRLADVSAGEPWRTALRLAGDSAPSPRTRAGDEPSGRWWDIDVTQMFPGVGTDARTIVGADDVTSLVRLEDSIRRADRMAAMGALTAGVAHEVRNPLFAIAASVDALGAVLHDREDVTSLLSLMGEQVDRMNQLMRDLLELGKPTKPEAFGEVPIEDVVSRALKSVELLGQRAGVPLPRPEEATVAMVACDAARLVEVFTNLLENAVQHSRPGQPVEIAVERFSEAGAAWVRCTVRDGGPGFRQEDLSRIFEPFFTRRSGGTGLGLSIVQRIVEQHGGRLHAANRTGGGASVSVELPCVESPVPSIVG